MKVATTKLDKTHNSVSYGHGKAVRYITNVEYLTKYQLNLA